MDTVTTMKAHMKSTAALVLCLTLALPDCLAQRASIAPRMTGQMLVRQFLGPPDQGNNPLGGQDFIYQQQAQGYLSGIYDATEGKLWCYSGNWQPDTLDFNLIGELQKLPAATLKSNAAPLVLAYLQKKYPCRTAK
jgi:hypothetical protein